jgi:hypothetical protein
VSTMALPMPSTSNDEVMRGDRPMKIVDWTPSRRRRGV